MNESNTYQSALFITLALDAEARCEPGWTPDAVTSVVMAFMAMEAFVNEVASVATVLTKQDEKIRLWQQVSDGTGPAMTAKERAELYEYVSGRSREVDPAPTRAIAIAFAAKKPRSTVDRYDLIVASLCASPSAQARAPRQALEYLRQVRNYLVHRQSDETAMELTGGGPMPDGWDLGTVVEQHPVPQFAQYLQQCKLIPEGTHPGPISLDFVLLLCRQKIATWACQVAAQAARDVVGLLPDSELRRRLEMYTLVGSRNVARLDTPTG